MRGKNYRRCFIVLIIIMLFDVVAVIASTPQKKITEIKLPSGDLAPIKPVKPTELLSNKEIKELNEQMKSYKAPNSTLIVNKAKDYYYYKKIDSIAKEMYDLIYQVAVDPVTEGNISLMMTDIDPTSDEFYREYFIAYRAVCFDHPELFWLYSGEADIYPLSADTINTGGLYLVYFAMYKPYKEYEKQMTAFNKAVSEFLKDINTKGDEFNIIRQVHDKLIDLVNYNDLVAEGKSNVVEGIDLAHTAYGCLVEDSDKNPNYAVCDGYSFALEYLLQQCGIDAIFLGGRVGSSLNEMVSGHAWNMVKMDGKWYEVDSTWDDFESDLDNYDPLSTEFSITKEALGDPGFREKMEHFLFMVSTRTINHFVPGKELIYQSKDGEFECCFVGESYRTRCSNEEIDGIDTVVVSLAPLAK